MSDKTTKILLAAIAVGLWANIGVTVLHIRSAAADEDYGYILRSIDSNLDRIYNGTCTNSKIC